MPDQMSVEEFGRTIKQKYPQYADLSDKDVGTQMLDKYPQYRDMVQTATTPTTFKNIFGRDIAMPPDVAAQYQQALDVKAGRQAPGKDVVVQNVQTLGRYAPAAGATVGDVLAGPPGAAVVGGLGQAVNLAVNPSERSDTLLGNVGQVVKEGAVQGVTAAVVPPVLKGVSSTAASVYRGYLKPSLAEYALPKAKEIVQTALQEALPISEAGVDRAKGLISDLNQQVSQMLSRATGQTIDLHAIAQRVRDFAQRKYFVAGRSVENYDAAMRVADRIDAHPALGTPPVTDVSLPTANQVKQGLYEEVGDTGFGIATGQATKEAQKAGAHELRVGLEQQVPGIAPLNARESKLIDAADAINRAVNREANQNALVGVKTLVGAGLGAEEYKRTGDPFGAATKALAFRWAMSPAVASRVAIVAYRLGKANNLLPATAVRVALNAVMHGDTSDMATSTPPE